MYGTCCSSSSLCEEACSIRPQRLYCSQKENGACPRATGMSLCGQREQAPALLPKCLVEEHRLQPGQEPLPALMEKKNWRKRTRCGSTRYGERAYLMLVPSTHMQGFE